MGFYEEEFSKENLKGYAQTCLEIALDMPKKDFDTLLLPSRGAVPIFVGVLNALYELGEAGCVEEKRTLERFKLPKIVQKLARLPIEYFPMENSINTILVPFTADIDIDEETLKEILEKERPDFSGIDINNSQAVKKREEGKMHEIECDIIDGTRKFWSRFVNALYNEEQSPYKNYYFNLAKRIENDPSQLEDFDICPKNVALIDTAISGRACSTILQEFDNYARNIYSFIVVDKNGENLKREYKEYLDKKGNGRALKIYKMNRIITEDRGSGLEGVISVVYPSLLAETKGFDNKNANIKFIPGTWHLGSGYHSATFDKFNETIKYSIKSELENKEEERVKLENLLDLSRGELINFLQKYKVTKEEPKDLPFNLNPLFRVERKKESGSRVIHVYFKNIPFQPYQAK